MSTYETKIDDVGYYVSEQPQFQPYGVQQGFTSNGQPSNYGPGSFDLTVNALAIDSPVGYGDPYGSSGTFRQLVSGYFGSLSSTGGVSQVRTLDPRSGDFNIISGRMDILTLINSLAGGKALRGVPLRFTSAFIPDADRATYYGGDPAPLSTGSDYIPGDDLPPGDPATTGWNVGGWNEALWNQEAA